ncbi:MAG: 2-hydroxyacid dehydrogenase [Pseudomonadota bacterium]
MTDTRSVHVLQMGPYPKWDEDALDAKFTVHRYYQADDKGALLAEHGGAIRGLCTKGDLGVTSDVLEKLPNLEIISVYGVGYDAVDIEYARDHGVRVTNTPDVLTKECADLGVAMLLAQARGMVPAEKWVRDGSWAKVGPFGLQTRVHGKKAGILGMGRIGAEIARRLAAFDIEVRYTNRSPRETEGNLEFIADPVELAGWADFLFITLAASADTRHIVNREVIEALGPDGMLINLSRAANVDEAALLEALESRALGSAALDVFEDEPHLDPRFLALDNVLLQPHHASATVETRKAMGQLMFDNLVAHFEGRDLLTPVV